MGELNNSTDNQLINSYLQRGDEKSLEFLIKKYLNLVYYFVTSLVEHGA